MAKHVHVHVHGTGAGAVKKSGKFEGKSNLLGHGGRAAQLKAKGVPGGVIGALARKAKAAPGQKNYHGPKAHVDAKSAARAAMRENAKGKIHGGAR